MCRTYLRNDGNHWTRLCYRTGHAGMRKPGRLGIEIPWELCCTRALATGLKRRRNPGQRAAPKPRCRICGRIDRPNVTRDLTDVCPDCEKYVARELAKWAAHADPPREQSQVPEKLEGDKPPHPL